MRRGCLLRGQNLTDLALIIGVVALVFVGMEVYIKRSVQGKVKDLTDYILANEQSAGDAADQYSDSRLHMSSTATSREFEKGRKSLSSSEDSSSTYASGTIVNSN